MLGLGVLVEDTQRGLRLVKFLFHALVLVRIKVFLDEVVQSADRLLNLLKNGRGEPRSFEGLPIYPTER